MKYFLIFIISFLYSSQSFSSGSVGILHGNETITYTSPFDTDIKYIESRTGVILKDKLIYSLGDDVLKKDEDIMMLKRELINKRIRGARKNVNTVKHGVLNGFLTETDLSDAEQSLYTLIIEGKENDKNITLLNKKKERLSLIIADYFILRNSFSYNNAYLKTGDAIVTVELLKTLQVEIKIDPIHLSLLKKGDNIRWKSLVNESTGNGVISYITQDDDISSGFKKVVISVPDERKSELIDLVDTPFEIFFDDTTL
ncbi:TPA_asm: HlyD family secretion protein [Salmonella enterica]|nr:HlyD family secretion protein [Salmonella enterica]EAO7619026.1 HlyD family secretion protein [Salmonella enterica]EAQ6819597.1 HlyD family secretion protein [Salmonella enterica]HAC8240127.1 HlyD family secretion protein [Salmonella enterica]HAC8273612.1 HlyD family secretion protein [Salmonella enterica]